MNNLKLKGILDSQLTTTNLAFLSSVIENYGYQIEHVPYREIAKKLGMAHRNVCYHFEMLEKKGYLAIERTDARKFVFRINEEKLKGLFE